jgi:hypothetical protein
MCGPHPCQPFSDRLFELPDVIGMNAPRHADEAKQGQNKVMFIVADVVQYERSAFAEQIAPQRKDNRPGESTRQIYPKKCAGGKFGYAENYGQNDSESIGKPRDERHRIPVFFNQLEGFTELSGNGVETFEQPPPFEAAEVEIELISNKRACPGGAYHAQNIQIPLKGKKTGQEQDCFTLQKCADEQDPVSVKLQIFFEDLMNVHHQPLLYSELNCKATGDF